MGTNYYAHKVCPNACEHCGIEGIHIGKSSGGWKFGFQGHPDEGLTSWKAWRERLSQPGVSILDEYGVEHSLDEFTAVVDRVEYPDRRGGYLCRVGRRHSFLELDDYHDAEGYDFLNRDFS